jgi:hypothetical protein
MAPRLASRWVLLLGVAGGATAHAQSSPNPPELHPGPPQVDPRVGPRTPSAAPMPAAAPAPARSDAEKHFRQAVQLSKQGRHSEALGEFQQAYAIQASPNILFNMGVEHERLGERGDAAGFYRRYLDESHDAPDRARVEQAIAKLGGGGDTRTTPTEPAPRPPRHYDLAERVLEKDSFAQSETIVAREVVVRPGAEIHVAGGTSLRIVTHRLVIEGPARIVGKGADGERGAGGSGVPPWNTDNYGDWQHACSGPWDAGGPGARGGNGHDGATIEIFYESLSGRRADLERGVDVSGGKGGEGGPGGPGRSCYGPDRTQHQKYGPVGPKGPTAKRATPARSCSNDSDADARALARSTQPVSTSGRRRDKVRHRRLRMRRKG